jgi:hypothetical protein
MTKQIVAIRNYAIAPKIDLKEISVNVWIGSIGIITEQVRGTWGCVRYLREGRSSLGERL